MIEEWKDVKDFNGYQVSNKGRVRSFKRNSLYYLTLHKDKSNLEMCTNKYNCNYGSRHTKLAFPIIQLDLNNNFIKEWISSREIERVLGFAHSAIINCCKGFNYKNISIKQAYGFKWKFKYERS